MCELFIFQVKCDGACDLILTVPMQIIGVILGPQYWGNIEGCKANLTRSLTVAVISSSHTGALQIGFKPPLLPDNGQAPAIQHSSQKCTLHFSARPVARSTNDLQPESSFAETASTPQPPHYSRPLSFAPAESPSQYQVSDTFTLTALLSEEKVCRIS